MTRFSFRVALYLLSVFAALACLHGQEPPVVPVGLDAYRQWDRWCVQRVGVRAYMRSTYDRSGGNEGADASHFLYQLADDANVTLDVEGPGVLCFARYNHWHGSPWRYVVDGTEHLIQESSSADPTRPVAESVFLPQTAFPPPLAWTWSVTRGADLSWVPIAFEKSFQMAYSRTRYGTGYYIWQQFVRGIPLSLPVRAWDGKSAPAADVLALLSKAGTDIAPRRDTEEGRQLGLTEKHGTFTLGKDAKAEICTLASAQPQILRALEFSIAKELAVPFGRTRLRVTWDDRPEASIDAPLALFFGAGTLFNRDEREYLVKAFPVNIRFDGQRVHLACYFPMPFHRAKIELLGERTQDLTGIEWSVRAHPTTVPWAHLAFFHATYRDHAKPERGNDLVLLDTQKTEGGGDWSGSFVGTSFVFSDRANLSTLEGDPRFFFDDSQSPQAYGTGTEEWGGGGDYWGGRNMTLPFAGHPVGAQKLADAINEEDKIHSAYRYLLGDLMPFGKNARIQLEHGGENQSDEHYRTLTYWYGAPAATLIQTDLLKIGDPASEQAHGYLSPDASAPYELTSRYELGPDTMRSVEGPMAQAEDFAEWEFQAAPGKTYTIWVRGQNLDGSATSDAFWMQFDEDIGTSNMAASYRTEKGYGNWLDRFPAKTSAWSSSLPQDPPKTVSFTRGGTHRLRIQPRHPGHLLERVWLSATQKELPPPAFVEPPSDGRDQIVLPAQDITKRGGKIVFSADVPTPAGALKIEGRPSPAAATREIYPAHTDTARKTRGTSEFTLKVDPMNLGVLLRRKLDYAFPNQRAEVFVADLAEAQRGEWHPAGIWYLAGSNTCVYSNPKGELGATEHHVQTSNRRFRDDEFLLPRELTEGRRNIRVKVKFTPKSIALFPGQPLAEEAWSELRYDVYCFRMPPDL